MRAARAAVLLFLSACLAAPARAGDGDKADGGADDDKAYKLKLLPPATKGQEEEIHLEATVERAVNRGIKGDVLKAGYKRRIRAVDEDGLPSREVLTVLNSDLQSYEAGANGSTQRSSTGGVGTGLVLTVDRSGGARRAEGAGGDKLQQLPGVSPALMEVIRRDPDGLASLLQPTEPMSEGDEWNVNRADLLALLAPPGAKLVKKGSRAAGKLISVKEKSARLELTATLNYTDKDAAEDAGPTRLKIHVALDASIDGSAPPSREELTISSRDPEGAKTSCTVKVTRAPVESKKDGEGEDGAKKPKKAATDDDAPDKKAPPKKKTDDDDE